MRTGSELVFSCSLRVAELIPLPLAGGTEHLIQPEPGGRRSHDIGPVGYARSKKASQQLHPIFL